MKRILAFSLIFCATMVAWSQGSLDALSLNGTDEWVDCSDNSGAKTAPGLLNLPTQNITLEAWVYPRTYATWNGIVSFLQDNGTTEKGWDIELRDNGKFAFALSSDGSLTYLESNSQYPANRWHHVSATYDGTTMKLYINGILDASSTNESGAIDYLDSWLSIGAYKDDNEERCADAIIDEVRIWNTARSESQIQQTMCASLQGNEAGLTHYYTFNGNSPNSIADSGPNGHSGVMNQMDASNRITSGAPIGNVSTSLYTSNWTGQTLQLTSSNGALTTQNINGVTGIHLYRIDATPENTSGIDDLMNNGTYYGIFPVSSSAYTYEIEFDYTGYATGELNETIALLYTREANDSPIWQDAMATSDINTNTHTVGMNARSESVFGFFSSGCNPPANFSAANTTASQTELSWTTGGASNWNIEYGITGFAQGSGTTITTNNNPHTLNGLSASTSYDLYVRDDCGSFGTSSWTGPISITTSDATIAGCHISEAVADWCYTSDQDNAQIGADLSVSGDFNNDGFLDIAISSTAYVDNNINGAVFIFLGSSNGFGSDPDQVLQSPVSGIEFGQALEIVGDMNGDGYAELAVGAPFYEIGNGVNDGILYIYDGNATGVNSTPWTYTSGGTQRQLGMEITSGDYNNDGFQDLAVSRPGLYWTNSQRIVLIYGSNNGPSNIEFLSMGAWQNFGFSMESSDLNNDGFDDLIVGCPEFESDAAQASEGRVVVYAGSGNGIATNESWSLEANATGFQLGFHVHSVGDVNNDGFPDFGATAKKYESVESVEGGVYIILGNASLSNLSWHQTLEPNLSFQSFGQSFSGADINNDGYSELFVGNPSNPQYGSSAGIVQMFDNNAGTLDTIPSWSTGIIGNHNSFGNNLSVQDVDNDGNMDLIVTSKRFDDLGESRGAVLVYYSDQGQFNDELAVNAIHGPEAPVIFPNPVSTGELLHISGIPSIESVELYDLQGRRIATDWMQKEDMLTCVVPPLSNGSYYVKIHASTGQWTTEKLLVH